MFFKQGTLLLVFADNYLVGNLIAKYVETDIVCDGRETHFEMISSYTV